MPSSKRLSPTIQAMWKDKEREIRKVYQENPLPVLKEKLKKWHFPELADATLREKLHDLGIKKNGDKKFWNRIYQHYCLRLKDPAPKNRRVIRLMRDTELIINGHVYDHNKAWKSMRRAASSALRQRLEPGHLHPLPPNVEIRTRRMASRTSLQTTHSVSQEQNVVNLALKPNDNVSGGHGDIIISQRRNDWLGPCLGATPDQRLLSPYERVVELEERVLILCLNTIPIWRLLDHVTTLPSLAVNPADCAHSHWSHQFLFRIVGHPSAELTTSTCSQNHVLLLTAIYILSNKLVDLDPDEPEERQGSGYCAMFCMMDSVFTSIPGRDLQELLHSRLDSVRAAFDALLVLTGMYEQREAFQFLVTVGATYDWLANTDAGSGSPHLLHYAASMGLTDTVRTLLKSGCQQDTEFVTDMNRYITTPIVTALRRRDIECARLLAKECNVNKEPYPPEFGTNFTFFLSAIVDEKLLAIGLRLFLDAGANVCKPTLDIPRYQRNIGACFLFGRYERRESNIQWNASPLDYLFYFQRPLFDEVYADPSKRQNAQMSRSGVLLSLESGIADLKQYLSNFTSHVNQEELSEFLHLITVELFLIADYHGRKRITDLRAVRKLRRNFGVSITEVLSMVPDILELFAELVGDNCDDGEMKAAQYLLYHGAAVGDKVVSWLARLPDSRTFDQLARERFEELERGHVDRDCEEVWTQSLLNEAASNNLQAVNRLLQAGVNPDQEVLFNDELGPISLVACVLWKRWAQEEDLYDMLDFLISKGAILRLSMRQPQLPYLLKFTLEKVGSYNPHRSMLRTIKYIIGKTQNLQDSSLLSELLLDTCHGDTEFFEYLFRQGAQLGPGSPLARWIEIGGGIGLFQEMLERGADMNSYTQVQRGTSYKHRSNALQEAARKWRVDFVELLLNRGADVNASAKGKDGLTALQTACWREAKTSDERERQLQTIRLLLSCGANVNRTPDHTEGVTALQLAARRGDVAVACLLIFHAPMAERNTLTPRQGLPRLVGDISVSSDLGNCTALDIAASYGRMDMVKLLLNCGATSSQGRYEGAISHARFGHPAVADLIRRHADEVDEAEKTVSIPSPVDWHEYSHELVNSNVRGSGVSLADLGTDQEHTFQGFQSTAFQVPDYWDLFEMDLVM